ncbi:large ribosomal subunit protein mL62-like [Amphiura filiformis]|uniref:large ribosomal subunit protein mL62-like n=1 Tax=Amphiura filiformis TaxID=82378 RepID=UPI003B20F2D5
MLRNLGPPLLYTCRNLRLVSVQHVQCRAICVGGFKSAYSILDKLYPNSNNTEFSSKLNHHHHVNRGNVTHLVSHSRHITQKETNTNKEEQFSGQIPVDKLTIKYSTSSGPGGQHVNKVNTKADVRFHVATAEWLPQHIREKILEKKQTKINKAGELVFSSDRTRSQITNFADCLQKIRDTVVEVTKKPKEPTQEDLQVFCYEVGRYTSLSTNLYPSWNTWYACSFTGRGVLEIEKANRERLKQKKNRSSTKRDRNVYV